MFSDKMARINGGLLPVKCYDALIPNICCTGADIVAARNVESWNTWKTAGKPRRFLL